MSLPAGFDAWLTTDSLDGREEPDQCRRCGGDLPLGVGFQDDCPVCVPDLTEESEMQWSNEREKISAALVLALGDLTNPPKDARNPHFNSRYTSLDGALDHVRPVLAKHGLAILQPTSSRVGADGKGVAVITTHITHTSGQWCESTSEYGAERGGIQAVASCLTMGRRYDLLAALSIAGDPDDDGNAATGDEPEREREPERAPARPQLRDASAPRTIRTAEAAAPARRASASSGFKLPEIKGVCGASCGKPIEEAATEHLEKFADWQEGRGFEGKFADANRELCVAVRAELARRPHNAPPRRAASNDGDPGFGDDDIPF